MEFRSAVPKFEQGAIHGTRRYISRLRQISKLLEWSLSGALQRARIRLSLAGMLAHRIRVLLCEPLRIWCPLASEIDGVPQSEWIRVYSEDTESLLGRKKWSDPLDLEVWHSGWVSGAKWALHSAAGGTSPKGQTKEPSGTSLESRIGQL